MTLILVSGTRWANIADHGLIVERATLAALGPASDETHHVYVGDEPDGVDAILAGLARRNGWALDVFEALWEECGPGCPATPHRRRRRRTGEIYCPYAGPRRNGVMIRRFKAAAGKKMLAFPAANTPSPGTENCLRQARKAGLAVSGANIIPLEVATRGR